MKRLANLSVLSVALAVLAVGCKNTDSGKMAERMEALEKRVEQLEKRPAFPARQMPPAQETAYVLPTGQSYVMGSKDAKISVVVFTDMECPFCAKTDPLIQEVVKDPELKGKVNVVLKHFPLSFHKGAKPAAKAALAAGEQGNDKFWAMTTKLYENQQGLTSDNFLKWAKDIGINPTKFKTDLEKNDAKYEDMIKADMDLGMKEGRVRGTPSIFVGGWELRERSVDGVKEIIKDKKLL